MKGAEKTGRSNLPYPPELKEEAVLLEREMRVLHLPGIAFSRVRKGYPVGSGRATAAILA